MFTLQTFVVVACVALCHGGFFDLDDPDSQGCLSENKISEEEYKSAMHESQKSQEFLCATKCIGERRGVFKVDGTLDMEKLEKPESMSQQKFSEVKECMDKIEKVDSCDAVEEIWDCWPARINETAA